MGMVHLIISLAPVYYMCNGRYKCNLCQGCLEYIPADSANLDCFIRVFHQPFNSIIVLNPSTDHEMSNNNRCTIPFISSHNKIINHGGLQ